jgi:hypothetical protein
MSNIESDRNEKRVDNGSKKSTSTIAGIPAADIKNALKELHVKKKMSGAVLRLVIFEIFLRKSLI